MSILFALVAAAGWGSSDFAAGHASRRSSAVSVVVLTHFAAFVALIGVAVLPGQAGTPTLIDIGWGLAAGLGGGFGAMLLFRGLGKGSMAVVAPVTATGAATIPALYGILTGESIGRLGIAGMVLALVAIVFVSLSSEEVAFDRRALPAPDHSMAGLIGAAGPAAAVILAAPGIGSVAEGGAASRLTALLLVIAVVVATVSMYAAHAPRLLRAPVWLGQPKQWTGPPSVLSTPGLSDALMSSVGFGLFFVFIAQAGESAGHWPLVGARGISVAIFATGAILTSTSVLPEKGSRGWVMLAGILDAGAVLAFVLSTRTGLLSVGAVLSSLYPVTTILLARFVVQERIRRQQVFGLVLAGVAVSLLALG